MDIEEMTRASINSTELDEMVEELPLYQIEVIEAFPKASC